MKSSITTSCLALKWRFHPETKVYFEMSLSKPHRGTRCIVSTLSGNHNVSLNLFPSHPCAVHSAIRLRDAGIITIQQHDMDLAVGKWHAILTHPGTEIACAQQSIPYRKGVEAYSVSLSVTLPALSRGASRPPLQLTSGAPTSLPM